MKQLTNVLYLCLLLMFVACEKEYDNPQDPKVPFPKPENMLVTETGVNQIKLTWNYTTGFEDGFKIVLSGPLTKTIEVSKKTTEYIIDGITPGDYVIDLFAYTKDRNSEKISCNYTLTSDIPLADWLLIYELDSRLIRLSYDYTKKRRPADRF